MSKKNMKELLYSGGKLIEYYRENPCIAAYELLGVDLAPVQRVVFEDMWFKPYVIVCVTRGGGKSSCVNEMASFSDTGLVYLHEVLPPIPGHLKDGEDEVIDYDKEIYTTKGFKSTKKLCLEKGINGKKLVTQTNIVKRGSDHHPLLTINEAGKFVYKALSEFKVGEKVCINREQFVFGNNEVSKNDAYLAGVLIGDGCITKKDSVTSADEYILAFCSQYCVKNNLTFRLVHASGECTCDFNFHNSFTLVKDLGLERTTSYFKSVPFSIRTSTKEAQVAFLQGYFDTDGTVNISKGSASCCSTSKKLLTEVQMMLLNFGIMSRVRKKKTNSQFGKAYLLDISSEDSYKFKELIGFRLKRKQSLLDTYFDIKKLNTNKDTVPYIMQICYDITVYYNNKYGRNSTSFNISKNSSKELTYSRLHRFIIQCNVIKEKGYSLAGVEDKIKLLEEVLNTHYFFDKVVEILDWKGDCYDFEMDMEGEPNYICNGFVNHNTFLAGLLASLLVLLKPGYRVGLVGPAYRQAKHVFSEVEKLYNNSSIFREACYRPPKHGSDEHVLEMKSAYGSQKGIIKAIPVGTDGSKIRGARFQCLLMDEFVQIPEKIIDTVLAPMAITKLDPMKEVRKREHRDKLISQGLASEDDFESDSINKLIGTSSGFYKFNHMYKRMRKYWEQIDEGSDDHVVFQIPYTLLPDGFLDPKLVENQRRTMSDHEFRMEYMADMVSDSEGFFKASMLDACTIDSGFNVELAGDSSAEYIIGIDPNQGGTAKCGVVIVKLGSSFNKVVKVLALDGKRTQDITLAVQDMCRTFNVSRIYMDKGGGGNAVGDLLAEGYNDEEPILDRNNDDNRHKEGRHILELTVFSTKWIEQANYAALSLVEDKKIRFPERSTTVNDIYEREFVRIDKLKRQCVSIVLTQTASGALHFDTPKKHQNKDLYSAFILACYGIKAFATEEQVVEPTLCTTGMVRGRGKGDSWKTTSTEANPLYAAAVLVRRQK